MKSYSMTIDGDCVTGSATLDVIDPSTAKPFATVPDCTKEELDRAVSAAQRAFPAWRDTPLSERQEALRRVAGALEAHAEELAELVMREQGKPLGNAAGEVKSCLKWLSAYASMGLTPELLRDDDKHRVELQRRPLGVVGAITPWNYPLLMAVAKIAPAVLTGNTVVLKPSPYTPVATVRAGEAMVDALPAGVVNVVSGGDELGRWITEHEGVRKISFTGSVATGKKIVASAAGTLKRVTLELGGNDAGIVLDDADVGAIAKQLFWSRFANCGQICVALKRLFVPTDKYEEMVNALVDVAREVRVGPGTEEGVRVGPVQNAMQLGIVKDMVSQAQKVGAQVAFESEVPDGPGYWFPLTILRDVPDDARLLHEEAFGPVLPVLAYDDVEDAIERANASSYGLGGSVWSNDLDRANALAARLETGSAWVNTHPAMGPDVPFGGVKESGLGLEGARQGLEAFTDPHVVWNRKG